ncbi:MAG: YbbR-like domain-containing protein [Anaerolineae bacterium]
MRRIINTLGSILLSLVLAFIIWAGATSAENPPVTQAFRQPIPIQLRNQPEGTVVVTRTESSVQLRLTAPQNTWTVLGTNDIDAYVDLSQAPVGSEVELPVTVQIKRPGIRVVEQSPVLTRIRLERLSSKQVPVRVNIIDSPPLGYVTREPVVDPAQVTVSGPEPAVQSIVSAGVDVWLRGTTETVDRSLAPTPLDEDGLPVTGVTMQPSVVNVRVELAQRANWEPSVPVRVNLVGEPAALYSVSNITVTPSRVTLLGLPAALDEIEGYINTEPIDITGATDSISMRVALELPPGVTVVPDSPEASQTVLVSVEIVPITASRTMQVPVRAQGIAPGLEAHFSPETVDVILNGPLAQLQNLAPESVEATVNLVDLAPGTHRLTPTVIVPAGIELRGILPEAVEVQLIATEATPEPEATAAPSG